MCGEIASSEGRITLGTLSAIQAAPRRTRFFDAISSLRIATEIAHYAIAVIG
jgi:hypothetical protein